MDIEHGLAFAPSCRAVHVHPQAHVRAVHPSLDALVLTAGGSAPGGDRYACYPDNRSFFAREVVPQLRDFAGIALVVSNPVDLMARLLHVGAGLPAERVFGLGTVVETARRVKQTAARTEDDSVKGTLHPIVEGTVHVLRTIARPDGSELTLSTLDPADPDRLFYSVPCLLGGQGLVARNTACLSPPHVAASLRTSLDVLRDVLKHHPD